MTLLNGILNTDQASKILGVSYSQFMRKYSKMIESAQIHDRGPRLYMESDILNFKSQMGKEVDEEECDSGRSLQEA